MEGVGRQHRQKNKVCQRGDMSVWKISVFAGREVLFSFLFDATNCPISTAKENNNVDERRVTRNCLLTGSVDFSEGEVVGLIDP